MKRITRVIVFALALGMAFSQTKTAKTDAQIKDEVVKQSIASYRGSCPCPYNTDRAGRRCGARSAYSRPGGASPLCYEQDVTLKMVDHFQEDWAVARAAFKLKSATSIEKSSYRRRWR